MTATSTHDDHCTSHDHEHHDHEHHDHEHHEHAHDHHKHSDHNHDDAVIVTINGLSKDEDDEDDDKSIIMDDEATRRKKVLLRLKIASFLCLSFFLVEVIGGILAGSLAVLSDAAHLLADLAAFVVAIAASHIATLPASSTYTFGYQRMESLAALFSMACLAVVSLFLGAEAIWRMWPIFHKGGDEAEEDGSSGKDLDVDGKMMSFIAAIGVVVNIALALVLGEHHIHLPGMDHGHDHSHEHSCGGGHSHGHSHSHSHSHNDEEEHKPENAPLLENNATCEIEDKRGNYGTSTPSSNSSSSFEAVHADELSPHPNRHHHHHHKKDESSKKSSHEKRNINLHAAYLHVLGDLAQSVAVLIAGLIIWAKPTWQIVDPICTILFCIIVFYSTISVMRSSISVLLEEVPPGLNYDQVKDAISALPSVTNVHDLHIWSISHGVPALSVHATAFSTEDADGGVRRALNDVNEVCQKFHIGHATIQIQPRRPHQLERADSGSYDVTKKRKKVIISECATCGVETSVRCR